jgi:ribonuclease HI
VSKPIPQIHLYTDGGADPNPGRGGLGFILCHGVKCKEYARAYTLSTNNRMELLAVILGLAQLKTHCRVSVYSDSKYVIDGIEKGWAKKWRSKNWMRTPRDKAINADLWAQLLDMCDRHDVNFTWVKGHNGHQQNERCDALATWAIRNAEPNPDEGYVDAK